MNTEEQIQGRYIYCIIRTSQERLKQSPECSEGRDRSPSTSPRVNSVEGIKTASPGIGGRGDEVYPVRSATDTKEDSEISNGVYSISYQDIAAVISVSPIMKYPISRENTMAHQKVLEELMEDFTVLPIRFGTVAGGKDGVSASERIKEEVLKKRYEEFKELVVTMDNKIELGLKAFWIDMKVTFREIVDENIEIRKLRNKLASKPSTHLFKGKATLGEMVKNALERKKAKEEKEILNDLKKSCVAWRSNKVFGDNMITNTSFLVKKSMVKEIDRLVDKLDAFYNGRIKFRYVGPLPPINFVELVITLEEESEPIRQTQGSSRA